MGSKPRSPCPAGNTIKRDRCSNRQGWGDARKAVGRIQSTCSSMGLKPYSGTAQRERMVRKRVATKGLIREMIRAKVELLEQAYYPDDSRNGTLIFYNWLRHHVRRHHIVLNVGAGPTADRKVRSLRGEVK